MKVLVAGDFCPINRVQEAFSVKDYSAFAAIKEIVHNADYSIVNLECPIVTEPNVIMASKTGSCLKADENTIEALQYAGFNCVTLANNHFRDYGEDGCKSTLKLLRQAYIDYVGGGNNLAEAQQVLYNKIGENTLAIVNVCEHEYSIASSKSAGSAPLDLIDNYNQITEARRNADYVLVIVHGGHEHYQLPSLRMKKLYRHFVDIGADAVVNHHQHCFSGYEYYNGKPIVYGVGNLCFEPTSKLQRMWHEGYMVILSFDDVISIQLEPYQQCLQNPVIELLNEGERSKFDDSIRLLNSIIADDELLAKSFDDYVQTRKKWIMRTFVSYHNRYLNALAQRSIIPYPLRKDEIKIIDNYIICESHRDVVEHVLLSLR